MSWSRRDFFKRIGAGAAALILGAEVDVEKLLWMPGEKKIFLPPEKKILDGQKAQELYNYYVSKQVELVRLAPKLPYLIGREVHTAVGRVALDAYENVVAVNGRVVGAREAAELRLRMFTRSNPLPDRTVVDEMVSRVISERMAAGWVEPVGGSVQPRSKVKPLSFIDF